MWNKVYKKCTLKFWRHLFCCFIDFFNNTCRVLQYNLQKKLVLSVLHAIQEIHRLSVNLNTYKIILLVKLSHLKLLFILKYYIQCNYLTWDFINKISVSTSCFETEAAAVWMNSFKRETHRSSAITISSFFLFSFIYCFLLLLPKSQGTAALG